MYILFWFRFMIFLSVLFLLFFKNLTVGLTHRKYCYDNFRLFELDTYIYFANCLFHCDLMKTHLSRNVVTFAK